jgi:hypothetical protein
MGVSAMNEYEISVKNNNTWKVVVEASNVQEARKKVLKAIHSGAIHNGKTEAKELNIVDFEVEKINIEIEGMFRAGDLVSEWDEEEEFGKPSPVKPE